MSASFENLLMLKNATVNEILGFNNVCKEKKVIIAYNNEAPDIFEVSSTTGKMVEYPVNPYVRFAPVIWVWEIQALFFETNNIQPIWINCNYSWGDLNDTTGQWDGAIGMIQRDVADYAIPLYDGSYRLSKVAVFSATFYAPYYWLTRYPLELPPTWTLLGLFPKEYILQMSFVQTKP